MIESSAFKDTVSDYEVDLILRFLVIESMLGSSEIWIPERVAEAIEKMFRETDDIMNKDETN